MRTLSGGLNPNYVKYMVMQNANLPIAFLFADAFRAFDFTWVPQPKRKRSLSDLFN